MRKISLKTRQWLKGFHVLFAGAWVGGAIGMMILPFANLILGNDKYIHAFNLAIRIVDIFVTIPAAVGSILTGFLFSLYTNWGFFKYRWMILKWSFTFAAILIGALWLGPVLNDMIRLSATPGFVAAESPTYQVYEKKFLFLHGVQTALIVSLIFISIFKPWKTAKKK